MPGTKSHDFTTGFRYYSEIIKSQIEQPQVKRNIAVVLLFFTLMFALGYFLIVNNDLLIFRTTLVHEAFQQKITPYQVEKSTVLDMLKQSERNSNLGENQIDQAAFQFLIDAPLTLIGNTKIRSGIWLLTVSTFMYYLLREIIIKPKRIQKIDIFGFLSIIIFFFISIVQGQQFSGISLLLLACIIRMNESLNNKEHVVAGICVGLMILVARDWVVFLMFGLVLMALKNEFKVLLWAALTIFIIYLVTQLVFPHWVNDFMNITIGKIKAEINLLVNALKNIDISIIHFLIKAVLLGILIITLISSNSPNKIFGFDWEVSLAICTLVLITNQPFLYIPLMLFPLITLIDMLMLQYPHISKKINLGAFLISTLFLTFHLMINSNYSISSSTLQIMFWVPTLSLLILLYWFKAFKRIN